MNMINMRREGISRLTHNATIKAGAHVSRFLGKLGMTVLLLSPVVLSAQTNGVTVGNLVVNTGSPTTVTFDVSWKNTGMPAVWSDSVWVFVDYNDNGTMKRLELSSGATLTAIYAGVGRVEELAGNTKGVRVIGNARINSSFSATVRLLAATTNVAGACAYASNYPPVAEYATASSITFTGTPPFDLKLSTGNVSVQTGYELVGSQTLVSFTDKTGAPGIIKCIPPATYNLIASATGFCEDDAAGITFSLDNTEDGVKYQLYRDSDPVGTELSGYGGAQTFTGGPFVTQGVYTAQVVAEGQYCGIAMSGSRAVSKNAKPAAPVISQPADVCYNAGDLVFTITSYGGTPTWTPNSGGTVDGLSVTFASGAATGTKTVTAQSSQTYTGAPACYSVEVTQTATINANPTVSISPSSISKMPGSTVTLSTSVGNCSGCSYQWNTGETGSSITATAPAAAVSDTYSCTVTNLAGCTSTASPCTVTGISAPPVSFPVTQCPACCWDGTASTWVTCYVTTYAYPFDQGNTYTLLPLSGADELAAAASYCSDGATNTKELLKDPASRAKVCAALGEYWYLPSINESRKMRDNNVKLGLPQAYTLSYSAPYAWTSTYCSNNDCGESGGCGSFRMLVAYRTHEYETRSSYQGRIYCAWKP
jgi:hypothetical protein